MLRLYQHRQTTSTLTLFPPLALIETASQLGCDTTLDKLIQQFPALCSRCLLQAFPNVQLQLVRDKKMKEKKKSTQHRVDLLPAPCQLCNNASHPKMNLLYPSLGDHRRHRLTKTHFPFHEYARFEVMISLAPRWGVAFNMRCIALAWIQNNRT